MTVRILLLSLLLALACEPGDSAPTGARAPAGEPPAPRARVTIGLHVIDAEVADTPVRRQRGLSGRPALADGQGMLFPYAEPGLQAFWMPDMHFDIDILWIRAGRIVHVEANVSKDDPQRVYRPREPADLVLELPSGTAERRGFRVGDTVQVDGPSG
jgi:uncharacterized membrane protein (UPF0127 family)